MTNFSTELSGSLIFRSSSITTAVFRPSNLGLQLTGSLKVSGSDIILNGSSIDTRISTLEAGSVGGNTLDPDASTTVLSHTADGTEEALFRFGTGRTRGYGAEIEINVTAGRPSFRHVSLEAIGVGANARREVA